MASTDQVQSDLEIIRSFHPDDIFRSLSASGHNRGIRSAENSVRATITLLDQIPIGSLSQFPDEFLSGLLTITQRFTELYRRIQALAREPVSYQDSIDQWNTISNELLEQFQNAFSKLPQMLAFVNVEPESRLRGLESRISNELTHVSEKFEAIDKKTTQVDGLLEAARETLEVAKDASALLGVSQQAHYFRFESRYHRKQARAWARTVKCISVGIFAFITLSILLYKCPWLTPTDSYQAIQLSLAKTLIFSTLAYLLFLSARNFMAHNHNSVVNRHRQNALQTFTALTKAADPTSRDVILTHAAACIFAPQETGYTKTGAQTNITGLVEAIPKAMQTTH